MTKPRTIDRSGRSIPFTIDGQPFETDKLRQRASAILQLAGLDPKIFDLGELIGKEQIETKRYIDDEFVDISKHARFISIRRSAPVA